MVLALLGAPGLYWMFRHRNSLLREGFGYFRFSPCRMMTPVDTVFASSDGVYWCFGTS